MSVTTIMTGKSHVKPHDFLVLSARGLLYLFKCLIYILCYTSLNQQGLIPLFGLSLLLTTLEGLCHSCICSSSILFNRDLGLFSSSKSVTSFLFPQCFALFHFRLPQFPRVPPQAFLHLHGSKLVSTS